MTSFRNGSKGRDVLSFGVNLSHRARVYTRSFVFFSVTSVTGLRNKVSAFFDDVPLFPENEGLFSGNVGLFRGNIGRFRENMVFFRGNELILLRKKLIFGEEMASVIVV